MFEGAWNTPLEGVLCHVIFLIYLIHVHGQVKVLRYGESHGGPIKGFDNRDFISRYSDFLKL